MRVRRREEEKKRRREEEKREYKGDENCSSPSFLSCSRPFFFLVWRKKKGREQETRQNVPLPFAVFFFIVSAKSVFATQEGRYLSLSFLLRAL